ncbi:MAG: SRPBCC domain-containing protein [Chitinivibrionales bacterium]|nr:SRPBCC domain-containing protein [Chitinivibrionales bacterium]
MKSVEESIAINTSPEKIWDILTDVKQYPAWNPFIKHIEGPIVERKRIRATIQLPGNNPMVFVPRLLSVKQPVELIWLGHLLIPGIFDGEHIFLMARESETTTLFTQKELFSGFLIPFLWPGIEHKTHEGFKLMNKALKELAEQSS